MPLSDKYPPVAWAPCKSPYKGIEVACSYIEVPTFYEEVETLKASETQIDNQEIENPSDRFCDHLQSSADDFELLKQPYAPGIGLDLKCREDHVPAKSSSSSKTLSSTSSTDDLSNAISYTSTFSHCQDSTTTIFHTTCGDGGSTVTKFEPCGCPNHITYIQKQTPYIPDVICKCEGPSSSSVPTVVQCTKGYDPDLVRRYVHAYLRTHPLKKKVMNLAYAIEKRRIESYNFWDPKTLRLFVKKYTKGHPKRAVFLVAGGPGKVGYNMHHLIERYDCWLKNNYVIYTIHHRGVGNSSRAPTGLNLYDSMTNPEIYISEFYHPFYAFNITNAAMDLYYVFQAEKREIHYAQMKWYIHACSYGTLIAQRLMVIKENEFDGVVLDGVISPNPNVNRNLLDHGHRNNEILKNCMKNSYCKRKIRSVSRFMGIFRDAECQRTRCARFLGKLFPNRQEYIRFIRSIMNYYFETDEVVGVQFAYALGKCPNYGHFVSFVQKELPCWMNYVKCDPVDFHPIIYALIMQSEIIGKRMLLHDKKYIDLRNITCSKDLVAMSRKTYGKFNYLLDPWASKYAFSTKTSVLILHGRLDGVTPIDNATDVYLHGNTNLSKIHIFENDGHTVTGNGSPCIETIIKEFFNVPMPVEVLPADECMRQINAGTLNWEGGEEELWNGHDLLVQLLFWLVCLGLVMLLVWFIVKKFK